MPELHITGDADADRLLSDEPLALLIGMLLDQQVPMEWAFASPAIPRRASAGTASSSPAPPPTTAAMPATTFMRSPDRALHLHGHRPTTHSPR